MARPRKWDTGVLLHIVDSYFESIGDPGKLKCSFLEEYAASLGMNIKAYDFRRNETVRQRMAELRASIQVDGVGIVSYKSMDVDAMMNRSRTREALRNSLLELDETWRRIYEKAAAVSEQNRSFLADIQSKKQNLDTLTAEKGALETKLKTAEVSSKSLLVENRYLRKMLRQYLYPAVANEILRAENVLEQVDTEVTQTAMDKLTDPALPAPFSSAVAADRDLVSRAESLVSRMREQVREGHDNA